MMNKALFFKRWCKKEYPTTVNIRDMELEELISVYLEDYDRWMIERGYYKTFETIPPPPKGMTSSEFYLTLKRIEG